MNKTGKSIRRVIIVLLAAVISLSLAGCGLRIDFKNRTVETAPKELVKGSYTPEGPEKLLIDADVANVTVQPGDGWAVEYALEQEPEITETGGVLTFRDSPKNTVNIGVNNTPEQHINVTVPAEIALELELDVGDVTIGNLTFTDLSVETDVGDVKLENVTASGNLEAESDVGSVTLSKVTANSVTAISDVGDLDLNLTGPLADYALMVTTDVGDVTVDGMKQGNMYSSAGGIPVFLKTDTGDIAVTFGG